MNKNRFGQPLCKLWSESLHGHSRAAANIKIKRNLKKKGFVGYQTVMHLMKCVQVQKNATEEGGVNDFNYLLHFLPEQYRFVSLLF